MMIGYIRKLWGMMSFVFTLRLPSITHFLYFSTRFIDTDRQRYECTTDFRLDHTYVSRNVYISDDTFRCVTFTHALADIRRAHASVYPSLWFLDYFNKQTSEYLMFHANIGYLFCCRKWRVFFLSFSSTDVPLTDPCFAFVFSSVYSYF